MSARNGNGVQLNRAVAVTAAVTVPTGIGGSVINQGTWGILTSLFFKWTASASAGNRTIILLIKDTSGLELWRTTTATALIASGVLQGYCAPGVTVSNNTGPPITFFGQIPFEFTLPPAAIIQVMDTASIDAADTLSINSVIVY